MTWTSNTLLALLTACLLWGCAHAPGRAVRQADAPQFAFHPYDAVTIRANPTTQIGITRTGWPDNTFVLWLPEVVGDLWQQWQPEVAREEFAITKQGGLLWTFDGRPEALIGTELIPQGNALLLENRVTNRSREDLKQVYAQNCIHFSQAPDFICGDFSRFYLRTGGAWRSLASLKPTSAFPRYYRQGYPSRGRIDPTEHQFGDIRQPAEVDHPLMVLVSQDGTRSVGIASEHYEFLFHNQMEYLRCIHSESGCEPALPPGKTAVFRQKIYFVDGGLMDCVAAFERDITREPSGEFAFRN